ncbi:hypothetical protein [Prevotella sp. KH2C16]|uniref:hypothetical protein n=1 Tax=Prevotella sp. KH2C16 TaxID=1855325 RepID=UPI0008EA9056|nr:hypothetical protein [Prevotella sp. KH2C16]SFG13129.1 hypothetical protein SAMN05216383_105187 [Prevotella sp. KH2C16]
MSKKIMFNDKFALTQAVLDGTKTMTRRIEKPLMADGYTMEDVATIFHEYSSLLNAYSFSLHDKEKQIGVLRPRYQVGEVVAIAQSYKTLYPNADFEMEDSYHFLTESKGWNNKLFVKADLLPHHIKITDVRMERLQAISDDDIMREGIEYANGGYYVNYNKETHSRTWLGNDPRKAFSALINKISGKGTWLRNPWVVVYEFEKVD